ncbi:sporulation protein YabP [Blautia sp.]|nr:sporulation protein YabP [uncultured Blautia sp.]
MEEKIRNISHKLTLDNRKEALLTGVKDVVSFDEKEILLQTSEGRLQIRGSQLHVKGLDLEKGEAVLAGHVDSLIYLSKDSPKKEEPLFTRLFR